MSNDDIYRKIERCMALAKSSNQNEAEIALAQAQKLMKLHNVSVQDISLRTIERVGSTLRSRKSPPSWVLSLYRAVGDAFSVRRMLHTGGVKIEFNYIGEAPAPEIAIYSFTVLFRQIRRKRKNFIKTIPEDKSRAEKTALADAYAEGFIQTVQSKCEAIAPDKELEERLELWVKLNYKDVTKHKGASSRFDLEHPEVLEALYKGKEDGSEFDLRAPLDGEEPKTIYLE